MSACCEGGASGPVTEIDFNSVPTQPAHPVTTPIAMPILKTDDKADGEAKKEVMKDDSEDEYDRED
jgi:hypothetical protein